MNNELITKAKSYLFSTAMALVGIMLISLLTSPLSNIYYVFLFFGLLFIALYYFSILLYLCIKRKAIGGIVRRRVVLLAIIVTTVFMLRTAGPLGIADIVAITLIAFGWWIYVGYRFRP